MSFQEKNITVTLVNFSLIFLFIVFRLWRMLLTDTFTQSNVFWLWGGSIAMAIIVTIAGTIITHVVSIVIEMVRTGEDDPDVSDIDLQDERDRLIDLRGTHITYSITSAGSFFAMLSFVLGASPLVMFSLLLVFGIFGQVIGDAGRLIMYRQGI